MQETVRYNYRLRPGAQAERALLAEWARCRWIWNECVHQYRAGRKPTRCKLGKLLTEARRQFPWLREGSQNAQQQMRDTYMRALQDSFRVKGRGRPVLKRRKIELPSLEYTVNGFKIKDGLLFLPKGVSVPVVWSRDLPSEPKSVRIYQDSLGYWNASFVVRRKAEQFPEATGGIGIDWGVKTPAATTDSAYDLPYLGHRKRCAAEVARAQRKMGRRARKRGGKLHGMQSKSYQHAARQAARLHKKAARQNRHDGRQWARKVTADHALIAVEDFRPKFLARSTMARKAADSAVGTLKRTLIEYSTRAGRKVVLVQPAYTTMTCSGCFARTKQRLELAERTFVCRSCGMAEDRDVNAARVILAVAERGHASAEDIRPGCLRANRQSEFGIPRL
jgi:putative transposase